MTDIKRRAVLAAAQLIGETGDPWTVTMAQVAAEVGSTVDELERVCGGIGALRHTVARNALISAWWEHLRSANELAAGDPAKVTAIVTSRLVAEARRDPRWARLVTSFAMYHYDSVSDEGMLRRAFYEEGVSSGVFEIDDVALTEVAATTILFGALRRYLAEGFTDDAEADTTRLVLRLLGVANSTIEAAVAWAADVLEP